MKPFKIFIIALMICASNAYSQKSGPEYIEEFKITVTGIPNHLLGDNAIIVFKSVGNLYKPQTFTPNQTFYPVDGRAFAYASTCGWMSYSDSMELKLHLWPWETPTNPQDYDTVVWGKYKILIAETDGNVDPITGEYILTKSWDSIYFDLSTTNYPWNYGGSNGAPDMFFRYEWYSKTYPQVSIRKFTSIAMGGPTPGGKYIVDNVTKGATVAIWDNYYNPGAPAQSYSNFYVAAPAHFNLGINTSGQQCPKLSWVAESFPLTYKIYRKVNTGSFLLYGNLTNSTANQFVDYELAGAGTGSNMVYYYITATNGSYISSPTNTKSINWNYYGFGKDISSEAAPQKFDLKQNYPNPFNPTTEISYQLPTKDRTTLIVYKMLGHKVRTLVDGVKEAGNYSVVWDGKDDQGRSLTSGVYLYQIRSGNFTQTKRMMLVK